MRWIVEGVHGDPGRSVRLGAGQGTLYTVGTV